MNWLTSSPKRPCPCCGRTSTDKCRWDVEGTVISCWWGDRWSPPAGLKIGDVHILADGRPWFVSRLDGGFGRNSAIWHPHREMALHPAAQHQADRRRQVVTEQARESIPHLRRAVRCCLMALDPEHGTLDEFHSDLEVCRSACQLALATRELLLVARRMGGEQVLSSSVLNTWYRAVGYQLRDLEHWNYRVLGMPLHRDIADLVAAAQADFIRTRDEVA